MWSRIIGNALVAKVGAAVVVMLLLFVGIQTARLKLAERRAYSNALARDSAEAAADSTRAVEIGERARARILGDSLAAVERRAIQRELNPDALDRATGRSSTTRIGATGTIRTGSGTATGTVRVEGPGVGPGAATGPGGGVASVPGDSVRVADFAARQEPFTLTARARLPRAGDATLDWRVRVDPARMHYRVQCGEEIRGIRPATVVATGPTWLALELGTLEQTPETCANAPPAGGRRPWWKPQVIAGAGYGMIYELAAPRAPAPGETAPSRWKHGPGGFAGLGFSF